MRQVLFTALAFVMLMPAKAQRIFRFEVDSMLKVLDPGKKDTQQIFTLLRIAEFHINMNGEYQPDLDSARTRIEQAKRMNAFVKSRDAEGYILLVESLLSKEKPDGIPTGRQLNQQAADILQNGSTPLLLGKALMALSFYGDYQDTASLKGKIQYLETAVACFEKAGQITLQANCLETLSDLYNLKGDLLRAEQSGLKAVNLYKQTNYPNIQGPYILVSNAFSNQFEYSKAVKYALLSLEAVRKTHDSTQQYCQVNNIIGILFGRLHEWEKAIGYLQAAFHWAEYNKDLVSMYVVQTNISSYYINTGHPERAVALIESTAKNYPIPANISLQIRAYRTYVSAYANNREFKKAAYWCEKMLSLAANWPTDKFRLYHSAMEFYVLSHQYQKARELLPDYRLAFSQISDSSIKLTAYKLLFQLDSGEHHVQEALHDLLHYDELKDSIFNVEKNHQIEELQIEYATAEKENNIKLLQKESEIQKWDIVHSNQTRNYSIAAAILVLSVGFGRYRLKQRQTRQLELKQKEITAKNTQLEKLLKENEWLLREVHHRVKNNLQVVMSLLGTQSAYLRDDAAISAVLDSQHRVQSMALLHQRLYKSNDATAIEMQDYIEDLVDYLRDTAPAGQTISFQLDIEPVTLDVVQAVPMGLLINEVVTNSIKHAFPGNRAGRISLSFRHAGAGLLALSISDDGVGLPEHITPLASNTFGLRLIRGLAEDLDAEIRINARSGLSWTFSFKYRSAKEFATAKSE